MAQILLALQRSVVSLTYARVWLYILTPAIVALVIVVGLSVFLLQELVALLLEQPPLDWVASWGAIWIAKMLALLGGWLLIVSVSYVFAVLLTAIVVLPLLLGYVAAVDYPDLAQQGSDSFAASTWNSVTAAMLFVLAWVVTLPLWLIPGVALVLPSLLMAWLNRRTFAYDALAAHASDGEWRSLQRQEATPMLGLGLLMALAAHLPFAGLLAPSLAALAYVHYCLEALRRLRCAAVLAIEKG